MTETSTNSPLARRLLVGAALVVSFLLVALDVGLAHYGAPADELFYHEASRRHVAWLGVISKPGAFSEKTIQEGFAWRPEFVIHPTFSRWCSGLAWLVGHHWLGLDEIVALRLHNAVAFALIAWGIVGYMLPRYGTIPAVVGLVLVWADVRLFGHAHTAQTDLVLACTWLWAVLFAVRAIHDGSRGALIASALIAGFALATKMTGILLVAVLAGWPLWVHGRRGLWMTAAFVLVPPLVFYALNPQSWHHPLVWTLNWLDQFAAREAETIIPSLVFGQKYVFRAPWYTAALHGLITIPPAILLLAAIAATDTVRWFWQADRDQLWHKLRSPWMLLTAAGAAPLVACSLPGAPNHDLERLFLPTQPLLILAAAYGFWIIAQSRWLARAFSRWPRCPAWLPGAVLAAVILLPAVAAAVRAHPYELTYFNMLVGGPRGADRLGFDVAYLKQEFNAEALDALNEHLPEGAALWSNFLYLDLVLHQHAGRLRKDIRLVPNFADADYVLIHGRRSWMQPPERQLFDQPQRAVWRLEPHGVVLIALFPRN